MKSGRSEALPYSLSRWTDVPAARWDWFRAALGEGSMIGIDPRTGVPGRWSLKPEDTLGLIFWTKHPGRLIQDRELVAPYSVVLHVTLTGWTEVEGHAPDLEHGLGLLQEAAQAFGPERVIWRFSPIPQLPVDDVMRRFGAIAKGVSQAGIKRVYASFLQENDRMPELRGESERQAILCVLGRVAADHGLTLLLCQDDRSTPLPENVRRGVCEDGSIFGHPAALVKEGCGCALCVDPFTINASCPLGCRYCYATERRKTLAVL